MIPASASRIDADWSRLCRRIGPRPAGGQGEKQAMEYLAEKFFEAGLSVDLESFPCRSPGESRAKVSVRGPKGWREYPALTLVNSASTPGGKTVEGELVWFESIRTHGRLKPGSLRGKIALLLGQMLGDVRDYRELVGARPLAVLQIDDRQPFSWPVQNALLPEWVEQFGAFPTAGVSYEAMWSWRVQSAARARVSVVSRVEAGTSGNVVATLAGERPDEPAILFGCHHDTVPGQVGADDNASGVVCLLELARMLASITDDRRNFIFASFGTEEQLSVGSAAYVRRHRRELSRIGLVVNFDSVSSPLGHNRLFHSGQARLGTYFQERLARRGCEVDLDPTVNPFSDHFPFTAFGIPGVWFYRPNVRGNHRWQHHSRHDNLANVSTAEICRLLNAVAPIVADLSRASRWPFGRKVSAAEAAKTAEYAKKWYGLRT